MTLDFTTLYVAILLNSLLMAIVWAVIYRAYDRFEAAGTWMAACLTTSLGGCALATEGHFGSLVSIFVGNGLVIFGFCLFWIGIRQFQERPLPWAASVILTLVPLAALSVFTFILPENSVRNVIYAVGQSIPLALSIADLQRTRNHRAGSRLAATGMALGIFVHALETASNLLQVAGIVTAEAYGVIEPAVVLLVLFNGMLWNFGLVLMVIDRLYAALQRQALHDQLTGLPNRRALVDRLAAEISAARAGPPLSMLVIDLDGLKELNDGHGHLAGDAGIAHIARTVSRRLRPGDMMARTGGDEFCIVLPGAGLEAAGAMAAALIGAVRDAPLEFAGKTIALTLSIGVAQWRPGQSDDALAAIADAALYEAKAAGRNRYVVSGSDEREVAFSTEPAPLRI